jgi:hypothetical protein
LGPQGAIMRGAIEQGVGDRPGVRRAWRIAAWSAVGVVAVVAGMLLPDLWWILPGPIRDRPVQSLLIGLSIGYGILVLVGGARSRHVAVRRARQGRRAIDRWARWFFPKGLAVLVGAACAGLLLAWAPSYMTWPWCRDEDTFATLAQWWDRGILPYRDVRGYNFPGHIYLHWALGKLLGWGRTVSAFYVLDAALVVGLGVALVGWSRRRLGGALPGLVSYVAFLTFYLGLEYELVAERDWHASLLAALGLMAAEVWPGRRGRLASALAMALALTIRPHAALFLPAMALAVAAGAPSPWASRARALGLWAATLAGLLLLGFAPILLSGIADDFLRGLRIASFGGPYGRATPEQALSAFRAQFLRSPLLLATLAGVLTTAALGPPALRRSARVWALALFGALCYGPLHPVQHAYLAHPRELFPAIALALPVAWLVATPRLARPIRFLAVLLILHEVMPVVPRFCVPSESLRALGPLVRGEEPSQPPPGIGRFFHRDSPSTDHYPWDDYRALLAYLRRATGPATIVANVLRHVPHPSVNGPTGRISPFLAESGICYMWLIDEDLDARFAAELESAADSDAVVVWCPGEVEPDTHLKLPKLTAVIHRRFRPEARFGRIEVWRRATAP